MNALANLKLQTNTIDHILTVRVFFVAFLPNNDTMVMAARVPFLVEGTHF